MPQLLALGFEILLVVQPGLDPDRDLVHDRQPVPLDPVNLLGIVGHNQQLAQAQVAQNLLADPVIPLRGRLWLILLWSQIDRRHEPSSWRPP